jgi:quinol monooxygenase YgiN
MADARVGLFLRLVAAPGRADALAQFLRNAEDLVKLEPETLVWYALQFDESTFGIFDAFADDGGRQAHLNGAVAQGLADHVDLLASPPSVEHVDVLASK